MCIKTLNPKAPEWRPSPKHRQPPPPPVPHNNISFTLRRHDPDFIPAYTQSWPLCIPSPPAVYEISAGDKPPAGAGMGFSAKKKAVARRVVNGPKCPPAVRTAKPLFMREPLPPRLRRAKQRFGAVKPPHPRAWRPQKPDKAADGRAYRLSPAPVVSGSGNNTTVMIKNIPNRLRRDFMLKFLDDYSGKNGLEYDFLYLPMDFRSRDNLGYAFVNFTTSAAALKFKNLLQNFEWGRQFMSSKVCDVTWARIQGRKALLERFKSTCFQCDRLDFLPVILDPPRDGSNPNPAPPVILGYLNPNAWKKRN